MRLLSEQFALHSYLLTIPMTILRPASQQPALHNVEVIWQGPLKESSGDLRYAAGAGAVVREGVSQGAPLGGCATTTNTPEPADTKDCHISLNR